MLNPPIALFDEEDRHAYNKLNHPGNKLKRKPEHAVYPDFLEEN